MNIEPNEYGLYNRLKFGKYKGEYVQDVIEKDPDYLLWCLDNIDWFKLTKETEAQLDERI